MNNDDEIVSTVPVIEFNLSHLELGKRRIVLRQLQEFEHKNLFSDCCVRGNVSCNRQGLLAGKGSWLGLEAGSSRTICVLTLNTITIALGDRTKT
jgi:hypothetical protein